MLASASCVGKNIKVVQQFIFYIIIHNHDHHYHVMLIAQSSLTRFCHLYRTSLLADPLDCIQYPYRADECKSLLVRQQWCAH